MRFIVSLLIVSLAVVGCSSDEKKVEEAVQEVAPAPEPAPVEDIMAKVEETAAPEAVSAVTQETMLYVTTSLLNVRSGPGVSNSVVRVASFKEKLPSMERRGNWVKVGEGEYVYGEYVSESEPAQPNDPVVETAPTTETEDTTTAPAENTEGTEGTTDQ